jgi:anti-sigma regulatory factor (Ser/Thr protein kinase)
VSVRERKRFEAELGRLDEILEFVGSGAEHLEDTERRSDLLVAAEEAFTNIAKHAYEDGGEVEIEMEAGPNGVLLTFCDGGKPFDPRSVPPPDLDIEAEERAVGGLGVHLMMNLVDEVRYRREEGRNVLTLVVGTDSNDPKSKGEES